MVTLFRGSEDVMGFLYLNVCILGDFFFFFLSINVDDESSFLHPPGGHCRNNVRFPALEKSGDCTFKCASSATHYDSYENVSHFPYDIDLTHLE